MCWGPVLRSHKLRIALVSSVASGLVLAVIFTLAYGAARSDVIAGKADQLRHAASLALEDSPDPGELKEIVASYPDISITEFGANGVSQRLGGIHLQPVMGIRHEAGLLEYGVATATGTLVVGVSLKDSDRGLHQLGATLAILWFPLALLVGIATWSASHAVFRPLARMSLQASSITGANLEDRIETDDNGEFGAFARQLNQMLARIEAATKREDQFASDAAHELRTPLAILRTQIETILLSKRSEVEYIASHRALLQEVDSLIALSEALLATTRRQECHVGTTDLEPVLMDCVGRWRPLADCKGIQLEITATRALANVSAEEFRIVVDNLLDNAIKYSPFGGAVSARVTTELGYVCLTVSDQGPGVQEESADQVFERLFRADNSRQRDSGSFGIGLSIVKRLVELRNGTVSVSHLSNPTSFRVEYPWGE